MRELLLTCGIPGSGKDYWVDKFMQEKPGLYIKLSADELREMIWPNLPEWKKNGLIFKTFFAYVEILLKQNRNLIICNTNFNRKQRKRFVKIGKQCGATLTAVILRTPFEVCVKRNTKRERVVPLTVLESMRDKWVDPTKEEGFDNILEVK